MAANSRKEKRKIMWKESELWRTVWSYRGDAWRFFSAAFWQLSELSCEINLAISYIRNRIDIVRVFENISREKILSETSNGVT